jgi:hypothetical protein
MSEERDDGQLVPEQDDDLDQDEEELEPEDQDDEPDEAAEGEEPEPQPRTRRTEDEPARRGGRANERIRELNRERNELRERLARLEGAVSRPPPQPQVSQAELDRQEAEQLALMSPDQQARYFSQKTERAVSQALMQHQLATADQIDRMSFERFIDRYPAATRYTDQVETILSSERAAGRNPSRETILKYVMGEQLLRRGARASNEQRRTGRRRIAREQTRPGNGRSTAAAPERNRGNGSMSDADFIDAFERQHGDTPLW